MEAETRPKASLVSPPNTGDLSDYVELHIHRQQLEAELRALTAGMEALERSLLHEFDQCGLSAVTVPKCKGPATVAVDRAKGRLTVVL